jgi:hypothetical protein
LNLRRRYCGLLFLAGAAVLGATPAAAPAQEGPQAGQIAVQVDALRQLWPETAPVEFYDGGRFEFRSGKIRIGDGALTELDGTVENSDGVVLAFVLGHEAWHSVQNARYDQAQFRLMQANKMLECEADFMGGAAAYRRMAAAGLGEREMAASHDRLMDWLKSRPIRAGIADTYPTPTQRGWAAAFGWGQAATPDVIRYDGSSPPADEAGRANRTCRKIVKEGDGSLGMVSVSWVRAAAAGALPGDSGVAYDLRVKNAGKLPITVNLLVPTWYITSPPDEDVLFEGMVQDALDLTIELASEEMIDRTIAFENEGGEIEADDYFSVSLVDVNSASGAFGEFLSTYYTQADSEGPYCIDQIRKAGPLPDGMLLTRFATVGITAGADFEPILSNRYYDEPFSRTYELIPAIAQSDEDQAYFGSGNPYVMLGVVRFEADQGAIDEYERLKQVFTLLCGAENVVEAERQSDSPQNRMFTIARFAPKARFDLRLYLKRYTYGQGDSGEDKGGSLNAYIWRDPAI